MQANNITFEIEIHNRAEGTWYENQPETILTVSESGDPEEYYITEGEHAGKHILKSDCRPVEGWRLTA